MKNDLILNLHILKLHKIYCFGILKIWQPYIVTKGRHTALNNLDIYSYSVYSQISAAALISFKIFLGYDG